VLDVHPPHEAAYSWRDFFVHLATITIGLLIALSLEGCVEWRHYRNLVHEAETSLQREIRSNAGNLPGVLDHLHQRQNALSHDVVVLKKIIANPKVENRDEMSIEFQITGFETVSWKTAQSTGALSYMPYDLAQQYSDIYSMQELVSETEKQAARDAIVSVGPFLGTHPGDPNPSAEEAVLIKRNIEVLSGQLFLLDSLIQNLGSNYKKFLQAHPE
jgi:hypothetical protein